MKGLSIAQPNGIAFDSVGRDLWVTHDKGVTHLSLAGVALATISAGGAQEPAAAPFFVQTQARLVEPTGSITNSSAPRFSIEMQVMCSGRPCTGVSGLGGTVVATLNGSSVGGAFTRDQGTGLFTYTPPSPLPEGLNIFNANLVDSFGHASNSVSATFTVDTIAPAFTSISPPDGAVLRQPVATVVGSISEPGTIVLESGSQPPASGTSFAFNVTLVPGPNQVRLRATDVAGNSAQKTITLVLEQDGISLRIESPQEGAAVARSRVAVTGTVEGAKGIGVEVNGVVAALDAGRFYATVSLISGANQISATASSPTTASTTKVINVVANPGILDVQVFPRQGIAPFSAQFVVTATDYSDIIRIDVDHLGSGTVSASSTDPLSPVETTYNAPGVYQAKVTVLSASGESSQFAETVVVKRVGDLDFELRATLDAMLQKLKAGDIEGALKYFTVEGAEAYRPVFQDIGDGLSSAVINLGTIVDGNIGRSSAEYIIARDKPSGRQLYFVNFLLCVDGVWRISSM